MELKITKALNLKEKPDSSKLTFGEEFSDHMFIMEYNEGEWKNPKIIPYGPLEVLPSTCTFHYSQSTFEGLKAYNTIDGNIKLFRPLKNFERLNISNERLCIPKIDIPFALEALKKLVSIDSDWIPNEPEKSLYIRPFCMAVDGSIGAHVSNKYYFMIILSPVGAYYKEGINPVKIWVETKYVRAVKGGVGFAKTGGNYASGLRAQCDAAKEGFSQVLWLDAVERKYIDEVGTMNVFFKIDGKIITPSLEGSILAGITRDSVIKILKDKGYDVSERKISINEVYEAYKNGKLEEAFGTGTAAVISPIGQFKWEDKIMDINGFKTGDVSKMLYDTITGIQTGRLEDKYGWTIDIIK